jgi:copper chaperone CopZ
MRLPTLLAFLLLAVVPCGCGERTPPAPVEPVVLRYDVEGMHCEGCVAAIQRKVMRVEGVSACEVSLEEHEATITISDPARAAELTEAIEAAIRGMNYTITPKPQAG